MSNTATRLVTLIMLMQSQPNQKAANLADKLGISIRTLHRYMSMLEEMGIPIYTERGPYGGFSLVRGYKMPPLMLTPEEAVAVSLGTSLVGDMWGQLYQAAANGALAKLDRLLPDEQRAEAAWARRSLVTIGLHRAELDVLAPILEKLRRAIRELRQVEMRYHSTTRPHPEARSFEPYALAHRWGWWYVVGFCQLRQELRTFRVDRILEINLTSQVFQIPPDFDAHEYLKRDFQGQPHVQARLRFTPEAAHIAIANRASWEGLEEQPDGSVVVVTSYPDLDWAASGVLAYGSIIEVLDPPELRQLVRVQAQAILAHYVQEEVK